jgi:transcriptional regulator GlxA family with amidase domain
MATPRRQDLAATHVHDLLALAIGATHEVGEIAKGRGLRAARLQAILAEIKAHFADPGFSPGDVAIRLRVSPRYVQDVLHDTGVSFTERVMELKLQKARAMLVGTRTGSLKVIDVAYGCGFGDISYFNRCFRRRFGAAPGEFRGSNGTGR